MRCIVGSFIVQLLVALLIDAIPAYTQQLDNISYIRSTFFGGVGSSPTFLYHIATDAQGYVYGTGTTKNIPTTAGVYSRVNAGNYDVMVFKIDPTLRQLVWATYIGGAQDDGGTAIEVNAAGEVFVAGFTNSANFPITVPSDQALLANNVTSYFSLKLSSTGSVLQYSRILGRGLNNWIAQSLATKQGVTIAINPATNNAYVYSYTTGGLPYSITANAYQNTVAGGTDCVLTKLDAAGTITYSTYIGGSGNDMIGNICYANNKIFITGQTGSVNFPLRTGKAVDISDCFVMVIDDGVTPTPRRSYIFGTMGTGDIANPVAYDRIAQRVIIAGRVDASNTFPYTTVFQAGQTTGGFVVAIDSGLTRIIYGDMLGTYTFPTWVAVRRNSSVYVAGLVYQTSPTTSNGYQRTNQGQTDGMLLCIDSLGNGLRYGSYVGGSSFEYPVATVRLIENDHCSFRLIYGLTTFSSNFPTTTDALQPLIANSIGEVALARFDTPENNPSQTLTKGDKPCGVRELSLNFACALPISIRWDFGDGSVPVLGVSNVSHSYKSNGTFPLTVTIIYPGPDTSRITGSVTISGLPVIVCNPHSISWCTKDIAAQLRAVGGVRYQWIPANGLNNANISNPVARPVSDTWYVVHGWDANGCESTDSLFVKVLNPTVIASKDTEICKGQSVRLTARGPSQLTWSPSANLNTSVGTTVIASPTVTTSYRVIGTESGCNDTTYVRVVVNDKPQISVSPTVTVCNGTPAQLIARVTASIPTDSIGLRYVWSPSTFLSSTSIPNPIVTPNRSIRYYLTVTNKYGCVAIDSIDVVTQTKLTLKVNPDTSVCIGSSVRLSASGGATYLWSPSTFLDDPTKPNPDCTPTSDIRYKVVASSGNCSDTQYVSVRAQTIVKPIATGDTSVCIGELIRVSVINPDTSLSYQWSPSTDFINALLPTAFARPQKSTYYIVQATSKQNCISYDTVYVDVHSNILIQASDDISVCAGEIAQLRIISNYDTNSVVSWLPNDGVYNPVSRLYTVQPMNTTTYKVTVNSGLCVGIDSVLVSIKESPVVKISSDTTICSGGTIQLKAESAQNGIQYLWTRGGIPDSLLDNPTSSTPITRNLNVGTTLFIVNELLNGCTRTDTIKVSTKTPQLVVSSNDDSICKGSSIQLSVQASDIARVQWFPITGLNTSTSSTVIASPDVTTIYTVTVSDSYGCESQKKIKVMVSDYTHITFNLSSSGTVSPNQKLPLILWAQSDRELTTSIEADVVCDALLFLRDTADVKDRVENGKSYLHISNSSVLIGNQPVEIGRINGHTLLTMNPASSIDLSNLVMDTLQCISRNIVPGILSINSCFLEGRNVTLSEGLRATAYPNPVEDVLNLNIKTDTKDILTVAVIDELGRMAVEHSFELKAGSNDIHVSFTEISSGVYTICLSNGVYAKSLPCIKAY